MNAPSALVPSVAQVAAERSRVRLALAELSRVDPAAFCEFVLRDEKTGAPIRLAPAHERWHRILTRRDRVVIWGHPEVGKSQHVAIGRVLWELGHNPNLRIVVISATEGAAKKLISTIRQYIERSEELKMVFPRLKAAPPRAGQSWSVTAITVERSVISKDPSIQAVGIGSNILGSRCDVLVIDDVLTYRNTRTAEQLDQLYRWVTGTPFGRLTDGARVWAVTNAWHPDDAMERLVNERGFYGARFPVCDAAGRSTWPERFPETRIAAIRRDLGTVEFARQMLCVARNETDSPFKREWIEVALRAGAGYRFVSGVDTVPDGYCIFHGVDLAVSMKDTADLTSFATILLHPDGKRQLLNLEAGRWTGPDIVSRIDDIHQRYGGTFIIENVAAQDYILQFAAKLTRASCRAFTTGKNKADGAIGVASLSAEFESGWWIVPSPPVGARGQSLHPEVTALVTEMVSFDPKKHTGDRLMSLWFAREGARAFERKFKRGREAARAAAARG